LAAWLSDPTNLGVAPGEMELLDQRRQYWPGYDEPVECYLFRFRYHLPQGSYENVGIAGPMAHALAADLNDLTPEDTYAVFAGWHAEHDEITEVDVREMTQWVRAEADRLLRRLSDAGFEHIKPVKLGFFFGERVLVTAARRDGEPGTAVADVDQEYWIPAGDPQRPIGPDEAYWMVKGRKLLQQFNP